MSHLSHLSQVDRVSFVIFLDRVYQRFAGMGGLGPAAPVPAAAPLPPVHAASASKVAAKLTLLPPVRPPPLRAARGPRRLAQARAGKVHAKIAKIARCPWPCRVGPTATLGLCSCSWLQSFQARERSNVSFRKRMRLGSGGGYPRLRLTAAAAALAAVNARCRVPVRQDLGLVTCDRPSV